MITIFEAINGDLNGIDTFGHPSSGNLGWEILAKKQELSQNY